MYYETNLAGERKDSIQYTDWEIDDGDTCDIFIISIADIGAIILGASLFFVDYNDRANKFTNQEDCFLSLYPKRKISCVAQLLCTGDSSRPTYLKSGGFHVSFLGGNEDLIKFATALKIMLTSQRLAFPQGPAEYVTFKL